MQDGNATPRGTQVITTHTDSREILANAQPDIARYHLEDYFIVDVDSHHMEVTSWPEIMEFIPDPVVRYHAKSMAEGRPLSKYVALTNTMPGFTLQDAFGRIPHQMDLAEPVEKSGEHRDVTLVRRAMDSMGIDLQVVFPTPILNAGLHPMPEIATQLLWAYNRWFVARILPREERIKALLPLPFENPEESVKTVREFADVPGVMGFMVTSQRHAGVHNNVYMPLYRELERRGLPLAFHAGPHPSDTMTSTMNRFLSVHAVSFVTCNMAHLTNWIVNGMPERFPGLKVIWIESGLAWVPFMMQRLDHEYLMRQSDAPLLRRPPSEYMREMYYTSQPLEATNLDLLESTFKAINAETQLLYSSDWPHWDFDLPGRIAGLPFLTETARRNILGENARNLFRLTEQTSRRKSPLPEKSTSTEARSGG